MHFLEHKIDQLLSMQQYAEYELNRLYSGPIHPIWRFKLANIAPPYDITANAWRDGEKPGRGARFRLTTAGARLTSLGDYSDCWREAQTIIDNWVQQQKSRV